MVFYIMAGVAGLTTVLLLIFGIEPRNIRAKEEMQAEPERHRVAKLHVFKQALGGVVVRRWDPLACCLSYALKHVSAGLEMQCTAFWQDTPSPKPVIMIGDVEVGCTHT